jgi:hypothetical protein
MSSEYIGPYTCGYWWMVFFFKDNFGLRFSKQDECNFMDCIECPARTKWEHGA